MPTHGDCYHYGHPAIGIQRAPHTAQDTFASVMLCMLSFAVGGAGPMGWSWNKEGDQLLESHSLANTRQCRPLSTNIVTATVPGRRKRKRFLLTEETEELASEPSLER